MDLVNLSMALFMVVHFHQEHANISGVSNKVQEWPMPLEFCLPRCAKSNDKVSQSSFLYLSGRKRK